ncbi:MAG: LysR substrate-binding domain-containing protein, partial [Burkholderiales bacterium]
RLFRLVVTTGSLSAAADNMSLSTSAASRLIAILENETRLQLFHRTRRRLALTRQGEVFYREAEHILAGFDEIPRIVADIRSRSQGQLRLVTAPRIGQGLVSPALALFCREHPEIRVSVDMQSRFGIEGSVGTRLYDLGIISLPVSHPLVEIENKPLFRVRVEAMLPEKHQLAARPSVTAQDLAAEPLLGLWPGQRWRKQVDDFFGSGGVRPQYAVETRSSLMACQLVRDGVGVALLDRICAQAIDLHGIVMRPLEPERWILFGYVYQARQPLGDNAMAFIDCMRRVLEQFRAQNADNAAAVVVVPPVAVA